jgi:hypothetical protein
MANTAVPAPVSAMVVLLFACSGASGRDDDPLDWASGGPPVAGTSGDTGSSTTSDDESTSTGLFDDVEESSDGEDPTGSESTTADTPDPATGVCAPNPTDAECTACSKANCCSQLQACSNDPDCECYMTCVYQGADPFGCGTQCAVDLFAPGPVGDLVSCSAGPCGAACVG